MFPPRNPSPPPKTTADQDTGDLARGAGVNYLGYVARLGSRVPFLFFAGLLYGEAAFGVYTFGITLVETAAAISLFGMKRSLFKLMSDEMAETGHAYKAITHGIVFALAAGLVTTVAVALGATLIADLFRFPSAARALVIFAPAVLFIVISDILLVTIRFTRQMRFEVYTRSLAEPITLTVGSVVAYLAGAREHGLAIAYTLSLGVAAITTVYFFLHIYSVRRCFDTRLDRSEMRRLITFSGPTAIYDFLIGLADKVDILLVSYFLPASSVGVYGMARQFATVTKKIRAGFDRILGPVLSDSLAAGDYHRAEHQLVLVARWILTVEVLIVVFFAFYASSFLGLLEGGFAAGAAALVLLMVADAINGSLGVAEFPVVYLRPRVNVVMGIAMLGVGTAANFWLIPAYGLVGAGLAVVLTAAAVNAGRVVINRRLFGLATIHRSLAKPLLAAIPTALVLWFVRWAVPDTGGLDVIVGILMASTTYFTALRYLGLEPDDEAQFERLRRALRRALRRNRG